MGVERLAQEGSYEQLHLFEYSLDPTVEIPDYVNVEHNPALRLPTDLGIRYLSELVEYGQEVASGGQSFRAKFEIEVVPDQKAEFVTEMKAEGCIVVDGSSSEVGEPELVGPVSEEYFLSTIPMDETYVEEVPTRPAGLHNILYVVTHFRLCILDRLRAARFAFLNYESEKQMPVVYK